MKFSFDPFHYSSFLISSLIIFVFLAIFFIVMGAVFDKMNKKNAVVPTKGLKFFCVVVVDMVNSACDKNFGKENRKMYAPYLFGVSAYVGFNNIASRFGLTPAYANLAIALTLSILPFIVFQFTGLKYQGLKERVKGFLGPVKAVSFLIFPISLIGEFTTPFSMGMRMFGNIFSGVVIATIVTSVCETLGTLLGGSLATVATAVVLHPIFDIFFGLLQMYVYFMLTSMFIKQNMN